MSHIDDFIDYANKDNREGKHELTVQENRTKTWDDGRTTADLSLSIDVGGKVFLNVPSGPLPSGAELEAIKESGDARKIKGVGFGLSCRKWLRDGYGVDDPSTIEPGFVFAAELRKDKKTGYMKVDRILPKGAGVAKAAADTASDTPF
jgi:hypothetical protein